LTETFLRENEVKFKQVIYGAPYGERILINDKKESGLKTAVAINVERNFLDIGRICIDRSI